MLYDPIVGQLRFVAVLVVAAACGRIGFSPTGGEAALADAPVNPFVPDADPLAPDADPLAPDAWAGSCTPACDLGEVCVTPNGLCTSPGTCMQFEPGGGKCMDVYDPVCSCDGVTYPNACEAGKYGASIAYAGECGVSESS
jgi:hypothetical protein